MNAKQSTTSSRIAVLDLIAFVILAAASGIASALALAGAALLLAT
jgi:hypothetical protein